MGFIDELVTGGHHPVLNLVPKQLSYLWGTTDIDGYYDGYYDV